MFVCCCGAGAGPVPDVDVCALWVTNSRDSWDILLACRYAPWLLESAAVQRAIELWDDVVEPWIAAAAKSGPLLAAAHKFAS
jgi:hypothetical protein